MATIIVLNVKKLHISWKICLSDKFLIDMEGKVVWQFIGTKENRPSMETLIKSIDK